MLHVHKHVHANIFICEFLHVKWRVGGKTLIFALGANFVVDGYSSSRDCSGEAVISQHVQLSSVVAVRHFLCLWVAHLFLVVAVSIH